MAVETLERDGVNYRAETGTGFVSKVEHDPAKRNAQVAVTAEGLQYPLKAWCDTKSPVWADVQRAAEQQVRITYRIEVKRARGVPADRPWADLAPKDKLRDLVAISRAGSAGSGSQAPPAPAEPPAATTAPPAPNPAAIDRALLSLREACRAGTRQDQEQLEDQARHFGATDAQIAAAKAHPPVKAATATPPPTPPPADPPERPAARGPMPTEEDQWSAPPDPSIDPLTAEPPAPGRERRELLSAALMRLRALNRGKADESLIDEQRAVVLELGATMQQLRWAADLDPATGEPFSQLPAASLNGHADPDRTGIAAPHFPTGDGAPPAGPRPTPAATSGLGARGGAPRGYEDPPPYKRTYETGPLAGQLNPSSYEVGVTLELVGLAQKLLIRRARAAAEATGAPVVAPALDEVRELAQKLLLAADRVQKALRGGSVDRQSGLYRRVRWAVQESIDWYPWPGAEDSLAEHAWHQVVVEHATTTVRVGLELLAGDIAGPAPAAT